MFGEGGGGRHERTGNIVCIRNDCGVLGKSNDD